MALASDAPTSAPQHPRRILAYRRHYNINMMQDVDRMAFRGERSFKAREEQAHGDAIYCHGQHILIVSDTDARWQAA